MFLSEINFRIKGMWDIFRLCPPQYVMLPPVTEHVSLHDKTIYRNMVRASGGANNMEIIP